MGVRGDRDLQVARKNRPKKLLLLVYTPPGHRTFFGQEGPIATVYISKMSLPVTGLLAHVPSGLLV